MTLVKFYPAKGQVRRDNDNFLSLSDIWNDLANDDFHFSNRNFPKVNIAEEKDMYEIKMAVPGIEKKNINIEIERNILKISHNDQEQSGSENYRMREFNYSSFSRTFQVPQSVNIDKIDAGMKDGILTIKLPKKDEAVDRGPKEIRIS